MSAIIEEMVVLIFHQTQQTYYLSVNQVKFSKINFIFSHITIIEFIYISNCTVPFVIAAPEACRRTISCNIELDRPRRDNGNKSLPSKFDSVTYNATGILAKYFPYVIGNTVKFDIPSYFFPRKMCHKKG